MSQQPPGERADAEKVVDDRQEHAEPSSGHPDPEQPRDPAAMRGYLHSVLSSSWLVSLGAVVLALVVGSVLILLGNPQVQEAASYLFARPGDFFSAAGRAILDSYVALFQGAIYDSEAATPERRIRPITETLTLSAPLIVAGLGVGLAFRSGLFNIGGQSQLVLGAVFAAYVGFTFDLPAGLHIVAVVVAAALGGAIAGAIPGILKARFGAHEVITTIMLNNIAPYFLLWLLGTAVFVSATPQVSKAVRESAEFSLLLGDGYRLHAGFLLALAAAVLVWWLLERSVLGFQMRTVGANPESARTAGMSVGRVTVLSLAIAGSLCGLAGAMQVNGTEGVLTSTVFGTIGFDAITVALLGRSRPFGIVLSGLLFGALAAGGRIMSARAGTEADLVIVLQSLIVLFIAAPPLVRAIFRLPAPRSRRSKEATA